jgi:hypothetical protein
MEVFGAVVATFSSTTALVEAVEPGTVSHSPWILEWWPLLAAAGVGLILWGELRSKVRELERRTESTVKVPERLTAIETKLDILLQAHPIVPVPVYPNERRSSYPHYQPSQGA